MPNKIDRVIELKLTSRPALVPAALEGAGSLGPVLEGVGGRALGGPASSGPPMATPVAASAAAACLTA